MDISGLYQKGLNCAFETDTLDCCDAGNPQVTLWEAHAGYTKHVNTCGTPLKHKIK